MNLCTNITFLKIMKLLLLLFNLIKYIIPLILIIFIMIDFFKAIISDEKELDKAVNKSIKRFIAAVLVFLVPTIVSAIFKTVNNTNNILACFTNANDIRIEEIKEDNIDALISKVKISLSEDDYIKARDSISKLKDKEKQQEYYEEIKEIKKDVDYNKAITLINIVKKSFDLNDYNKALNYINTLDNSKKQELISKLNETKYLVDLKVDILNLEINNSNYESVYNRILSINDESIKNSFLELIKKYNKHAKLLDITSGAFERNGYYEVIPDSPEENMPLIIFLHGYVENMGMTTLKNLPISKYVTSKEAFKVDKFIFVAPLTNNGWNVSNIMNLIETKVSEYKIDKTRIIITGHSMGGRAVWEIVNKYPNYFAGAMPMSYPPYDPVNSNKLFVDVNNFLTTPIYAIHGSSDNYPEKSKKFVEMINNAGGKATMDIRSNDGYNTHGTVPNTYNGPELFRWMLNQKRTQ